MERTTDYTTEQLADGAYRRVYSIAEGGCGGTYGLLSCGYHNGAWTLSTNGQTIQYVWFDHAGGLLPAPVTVEHKNVVITSATASGGQGQAAEYWLFDPAGYSPQNPPTLLVTFAAEKLMTEQATATLRVYASDRSEDLPLATITAPACTNGSGQEIARDGMVEGQLVPKGIYVFDLNVASHAFGDWDDHKSQTLWITWTNCAWTSFDAQSGSVTVRTDYDLTEAGSAAWVRLYDPDFGLRTTFAGPAAGGGNSAYGTVLWNRAGPFRFVVNTQEETAKDHRHADRAFSRGALQRNSSKDVKVEVAFSPAGFLPMPEWANGTDGQAEVTIQVNLVGGTPEDRATVEGQQVSLTVVASAFAGYCSAERVALPAGVPTESDYSFAPDQVLDQKAALVQGGQAAAVLYAFDCGGVVAVTARLGELTVGYVDPNVDPNDPDEVANPAKLWIPSPRKGYVPENPLPYLPRVWVARYQGVLWAEPPDDLGCDAEPLDPDAEGPCPPHARMADRRTAWEEYRGYPVGGSGVGQIVRLSPQDKEALFEVDIMASPHDPHTPICSIADIEAKLQRTQLVHSTGSVQVYWKFDETTAEYRAPESFAWIEDVIAYMRQHKNPDLPRYGYLLYTAGDKVQDVAYDGFPMEDRGFCSTSGIMLSHFASGATAHEIGHTLNMRDAYMERPPGWRDMLMGWNMYGATTLVAWEIVQIAITGRYFK